MVAQFANEGLILCAPNYRRPPEVSIIDAVDDCLATYRYLVDVMRIDASKISIMGDSAGGALTVLLLCRIRDEKKLPLPSCGVLLSPWVELDDPTIVDEAAKGNIMPDHDYLPRDALVMISRLVVGSLSATDPRINPISADLKGLPKLLIHVGELELLFDQVTRFYEKIRDDGGEVRMKIWIDGVHVPHVFTPVNEEARVAVHDAAYFIKQNTHGIEHT
jgi:acetyl esterase/lipase